MSRKISLFNVLVFLCAISSQAEDRVVATINGKNISEAEMNSSLKPQMFDLDTQRYQTQMEWLEEEINNRLLADEAARRKMAVDQLNKKELEGKIKKVTEKEAKDFYEANKDRYTKSGKTPKPYDEIKPKIYSYLEKQKVQARREEFLSELKKKSNVKILLTKPEPPKIDISFSSDDASFGNPDARVAIVEFTDFQCPFCIAGKATLQQLLEKYPNDVKIVTRHFPLSGHEGARPMALASLCAKDQGKYKEYREKIFGMEKVDENALVEEASKLGLDKNIFQQCLSSKKYNAQIDRDLADGAKYGVKGTPAFFVNGYPIMGAAPFEDFEAFVQKALSENK